jgi:KUP system potassium uptake protein
VKVAGGGYVPLLLGSIVYGVMLIWHRGSTAVARALNERVIPISEFLGSIESRKIPRVPGTAIFLTRTLSDTPPVVVWHVKHNRALHEHLFVLRVVESIPRIKESERLATTEVAPNFWRATAHYGIHGEARHS